MEQSNWDRRLIQLAKFVGAWSKDRSRQVGCVIADDDRIVRSIGYNGFPRGVNDDVEVRHGRPAKYLWTEHAERNALYNAARLGVAVKGCTIYIPWYPCVDCARAIVQSGLREVVAVEPDWNDPTWKEHFRVTKELFEEVDIRVRWTSLT